MNETIRNRLIGVAVVLIILFLLTLLIPSHHSESAHPALAVSAVPVGSSAGTPPAPGSSAETSSAPAAPLNQIGGSNGVENTASPPPAATVAAPADSAVGSVTPSSLSARSAPSIADNQPVKALAPAHREPQARPDTNTHGTPKAAAVKVSPDRSAKASSDNAFYVQVGSYHVQNNARNVEDGLKKAGYAVKIDPVSVSGHRFYRVRVGPFSDKGTARAARKRIAASGYKNARVFTGQ